MHIVYSNEFNNTDNLNVYEFGYQDCDPNYSYGPAIRNFYIIHYVKRGKGIFKVNNETYNLYEGQAFLICPNTLTYYKADLKEPWSYCWIVFNGILSESYALQCGFNKICPIISNIDLQFVDDCFNTMLKSETMNIGRSSFLRGYLYILLSRHIEDNKLLNDDHHNNLKEKYVKKAVEFIKINYNKKISVQCIADYVNIDSKYLWRLFKQSLNISPSDFIIKVRLETACELMHNKLFSLSDISRSVGYSDFFQFSKMFKKWYKISPTSYRKSLT